MLGVRVQDAAILIPAGVVGDGLPFRAYGLPLRFDARDTNEAVIKGLAEPEYQQQCDQHCRPNRHPE
jgi:hypothetical protein